MKKLIHIIFVLFLSGYVYSQSYPVAVNDTVDARFGEYITVNVINNDYHPEGKFFKIGATPGSPVTYTDSTLSFYVDYDNYYNYNRLRRLGYRLVNEDGEWGIESWGLLCVNIINDYADTLDFNNIQALVTPYASHFWQGVGYSGNPGDIDSSLHLEYPKGSGKQTIFTSTFWIGGIDQNEVLRVSAERYRQVGIDYWSGPLSFENGNLSIDTSTVIKWHQLWKLNRSDIVFHKNNWWKPGYMAMNNIENWPAHGDENLNQSKYLAPFVDIGGDGHYDPYSGDYPLIKGDQCVFFIFNDLREDHTETRGNTIGIEIHGMMYQFEEENNTAINNTVFLSYKVFNRSAYTLSDTYIGIWSDIDLGYANDDYVGCDVERGMYFGYNGEEIDGHGELVAYGENPPAQGVLFLGGPNLDSNNIDDPDGGCDESINGVGFGDSIIDNERYGMTGFMYHNNGGNQAQSDPQNSEDYYSYLRMIWKDDVPMDYGSLGHPNGDSYGPTCKFMFPALSDPCMWGTYGVQPNGLIEWSEEIGYHGNPNPPADRRGLGSMGPFTFLPGTMQKIDIAYVVARGDDGPMSSVELLKVFADSIRARFILNSDDFGTQYLGVEESKSNQLQLKIYPNPVGDILHLEIPNKSQNTSFAIFDIYGRLIMDGEMNQEGSIELSVSELKEGVYIITVIEKNQLYSTKILKK